MYTWSELTVIQKILCVAGWVSIGAWLVLIGLNEAGILEASALCYALQGAWSFSNGCIYKNRWLSALWYVFAGMWLALCLRVLF